ncbi:hypothetical protein SAMN04489713_104269 [Actinomadura madurae]|uniref:Uncharacterized protein n=1 Tax=Actinomadura madurae TaxID=1993 RepID=A0A1I5ESW5_9ACTN|nr:hypothetical protein [Actinomadura madurae]SFO14604.1 hypothetical protein SAMN04489713_104269 [Actinomadura madurae]
MSTDLRAALGRLTAGEREALATRWRENAAYWSGRPSGLGAMWAALVDQVAEVDALERLRAAAETEPHTMREARRPRR